MLGLSVGLTKEEMSMLGAPDGCPTFDDTDRLVLRYTETLVRQNRVDDGLFNDMAARFPQDELMELCLTIGFSSLVNRMHATFRTDLDESTADQVGDALVCLLPTPITDMRS